MNESELDKERRYLVPVAEYDSDEVHLSVYEWLPRFEEWATGMSLCGGSMMQGALPGGTVVTCPSCEDYRPKYQRYLGPGYRPEDDDPEVLRARAEKAEQQVAQARALVERWRETAVGQDDAVLNVGVAADVLAATLDGFNDLLGEGAR